MTRNKPGMDAYLEKMKAGITNTPSRIAVFSFNVDELPDVKERCEVQAMPTFQFYKRGKKVDELVGADMAKFAKKLTQLTK